MSKEVIKETTTKVQPIDEKTISSLKSARDMTSPRKKVQMKNQVLKVTILDAKIHRTSLDQTDQPDTYVTISHGSETVKSKTVTKSNLPKFNEDFALE
jgi:hypothetical protein